MASALNTKINSYTLNRGIEFDFAVSNTPTRTGTNPLGAYSTVAGNTQPIYESTVGPPGGSGSWKFNLSNVSTSLSRLVSNTSTSTLENLGIPDGDWSVGIWFNIASIEPAASGTFLTNILSIAPVSTNGLSFNIRPSNSPTNPSTIGFQPNAGVDLVGPVITPNQWHYVATVKTGTSASYYYDGALVGTRTGLSAGGTTSSINFNGTSYLGTTTSSINLSNYYLTSSATIGATQIAEIYAIGKPSTGRTVKYYNGTSWVDSSAQKVYNGTAWIDWDAKRWDGTAWVTV